MGSAEAAEYFRDLYELGINESLSLDEKIDQAVTIGADRLGLPYGWLSYTGDDVYEIVSSKAADGPYATGNVHDIDKTYCRHVISDQRLLAIADASNSEYQEDAAREASQLECYIGAPIIVDGESYGSLCYSDDKPRATEFSADDRRFVRLLTRWIGYEIERERHYRTLDRQNERLAEFAGVLTHDLRNPLTAARGYVELVFDTISAPESGYLQTALDSLDRMEALIGDTLTLAREGEDVGEREVVALGAVAQAAWETVSPSNADLTVEADTEFLADRSRLQRLFENLFRNVAEHCGEDVTVTVRGTDDGFTVSDDGPGLPESIATSLFDSDVEHRHVGLGLLIIERVVSGHGWNGNVTIDDGTQFHFTGVETVTNTINDEYSLLE